MIFATNMPTNRPANHTTIDYSKYAANWPAIKSANISTNCKTNNTTIDNSFWQAYKATYFKTKFAANEST